MWLLLLKKTAQGKCFLFVEVRIYPGRQELLDPSVEVPFCVAEQGTGQSWVTVVSLPHRTFFLKDLFSPHCLPEMEVRMLSWKSSRSRDEAPQYAPSRAAMELTLTLTILIGGGAGLVWSCWCEIPCFHLHFPNSRHL